MTQDATFPLADSLVLDNPFPFFKQCRRDSPILFNPAWNAWFVFSHDDITALSRDARLSAKRMDLFKQIAPSHLHGELSFLETDLHSMVVMLDAPEHHRVRQNLQRGFNPQTIRNLESKISHHVDTLIDSMRDDQSCDVAGRICRQLPLLVLADLFDLPEKDFPKLQQWAYDFIEYFNRNPVPETYALALIRSGKEMMTYTRSLIEERRTNPGNDLISALLTSESASDGLSDDEIIANVMMVLIAGHDTVGSALGNAVYLLLSHREQLEKIEAGESSWADAFEECLRYEPANPVIMRKVAESFEYKGHSFEQHQSLFLVLASGSRDENYVHDSEHFEITRQERRHMTFGTGAHFCIGAALARTEALALLPKLFQRLPGLRLDLEKDAVWLRTLGVRGPRSLPVVYEPPAP